MRDRKEASEKLEDEDGMDVGDIQREGGMPGAKRSDG